MQPPLAAMNYVEPVEEPNRLKIMRLLDPNHAEMPSFLDPNRAEMLPFLDLNQAETSPLHPKRAEMTSV